METNEITATEEVMEATEEIVTTDLGKGLTIAIGIGLAGLGGWLAYKYVIKPIVAKIKAKSNQTIELDADDYEDTEIYEEPDLEVVK